MGPILKIKKLLFSKNIFSEDPGRGKKDTILKNIYFWRILKKHGGLSRATLYNRNNKLKNWKFRYKKPYFE
jgi:hypothetical protein